MSRRWLVAVSVVAHLAIVGGLVVSGIWRIEQVERGRGHPLALGAPLPPPPAASGGHTDPKPTEPTPRPRIARGRVQPAKKPAVAPIDTGNDAHDRDIGNEITDIDGPCLENCGEAPPAAPVCGNGSLEVGEQCDDGNTLDGDGCSASCRTEARPAPPPATATVIPSVLQGLRISGETQVHPSTVTQNQMIHDNATRVEGIVKLCLDTGGSVASARMLRPTGYGAYDQTLLAAVRDWRYRPYTVNSTPVPACSTVTFIYTMR
jgi:TonB family protein